jgi:hypothetical protein
LSHSTLTLRDWHTDWALPAAQSLVRKQGGKAVYRVTSVRKVRLAGTPDGMLSRVELGLERQKAGDSLNPDAVAVVPDRPVPDTADSPDAVQRPSVDRETPSQPTPASAPQPMGSPKPGRRRKGRGRKPFPPPSESDPPHAQRMTVRAADGTMLRHALIDKADWRDPEDKNRSSRHPRVIRGWVAADSMVRLRRQNPAITDEHLLAADLFRETWERWAASTSPSMISYMRVGGRSGAFQGSLNDRAVKAFRVLRLLQRQFHPTAWSCLVDIVLDRGYVSAWGEQAGVPGRTYAVGYLISVLDTLAWYFHHEIGERRSQVVRETLS